MGLVTINLTLGVSHDNNYREEIYTFMQNCVYNFNRFSRGLKFRDLSFRGLMFRGLSFRGLRSEVSRSEFSRQPRSHTRSNIMTSKYKSEANLFLTYKKARDIDDLYDPSLIGVTYNEKNSGISLYALTSKTDIKCQHTVFREFVK